MRTAEDLPQALKGGPSHRLHMPGVWIIHGEYSTPGAETGLLSMVSNTAGIHLGAACTMPVCTSHPQVDKLIFYKRLYLKAKQ